MILFTIIILITISCKQTLSQFEANSFHAQFDSILKFNVRENGGIDYSNITINHTDLFRYTTKLSHFSPNSHPNRFPTPMHTLSYWINAYNATIIAIVVRHYPIDSILDINTLDIIFQKTRFNYGGEYLSLNEIETHKLLRKFKDPRIHFASNCASIDCPPIKNSAYTYLNVETDLISLEKRFSENPEQLLFKNDTLFVHKIFDWYADDFKKWFPPKRPYDNKQHVSVNYFSTYIPALHFEANRIKRIPVRFFNYNWLLNDSKIIDKYYFNFKRKN